MDTQIANSFVSTCLINENLLAFLKTAEDIVPHAFDLESDE